MNSKFIGLIIITLVLSLCCVPYIVAGDAGGLNNSTDSDFTDLNSTVNDTINNTVKINYISTSSYPIFTGGTDLDPITPENMKSGFYAWNTDLRHKHDKYGETVTNYVSYAKEVIKIADESYANGTNNYTSGSGTMFQHVPKNVMRQLYHEDNLIDNYETKLKDYYDICIAYWNIWCGVATGVSIIVGAIVTKVCVICAASVAAAAADGTQVSKPTAFAGSVVGGTIIVICTSLAILTPGIGINAYINSRKSDLSKIDIKFQDYHRDAKSEIPYFTQPDPVESTVINDTVNDTINSTFCNVTNPLDNTTNITNDTNITEPVVVNDTEKNITIPYDERFLAYQNMTLKDLSNVTTFDVEKLKTEASNQAKADSDLGMKFEDWNPWIKPNMAPGWHPPGIRSKKWYNFFGWLGDCIKYGLYCIKFGISTALFWIGFAISMLAYILYYVFLNFAYLFYNLGVAIGQLDKYTEIAQLTLDAH